jgi:hypothetical protein
VYGERYSNSVGGAAVYGSLTLDLRHLFHYVGKNWCTLCRELPIHYVI